MTTTTLIVTTVAFLSLIMGEPLQAQDTMATPQYVLTDLGTLGGKDSDAYAINNEGHIVGTATTAGGQDHAFLWKDGRMADLGVLPSSDQSRAYAISDTDCIVGECQVRVPLATDRYDVSLQAALWKEGNIIDLGKAATDAEGVNDLGQVVGVAAYDTVKKQTPGFLWTDGHLSLLQPKAGYASLEPQAINTDGTIVGSAVVLQSGERHPFLWHGGQFTDLGKPGESCTFGAFAINRAGQVAGQFEQAACLWTKGRLTILGRPAGTRFGFARGLNNVGQVVGCVDFSTSDYGDQHAFLWQNGRMYKLEDCLEPSVKWILREARGINDRGQIVGSGSPPSSPRDHAFLLTPKSELRQTEATRPQ